MVRVTIKGGIWKNTEDEILKAAVMKYGLNQWSRISSLLTRKSAKQCKARWFEWLDPAIKKTEWTREEDEKLLHLAKLLPCQWRTIAPIVGRTPAQCLERYEKLLDQAVSRDESYDPRDDPRRLRPGEIDPNPETKPARPDAVDMDEDEKEMLSEARARLANTRGKKAKRKGREKQVEEARRLAALQKKRELKAAGIETRDRKRNFGAVDYNAEVAFEVLPALGFHDTGEEGARTRAMQQEFRPVSLEELEGRRRRDVEEARMKQDLKRAKIDENHDVPGAVAKTLEVNDPGMGRRRGRLMLPAPQVSEAELEAIARMGGDALAGGMDVAMLASLQGGHGGGVGGGEATRGLLGTYGSSVQLPQAMKTPRTAATGDRLMADAAALARLTGMGTVLEGGEGPDVGQMDFAGITPRPQVAATPNPLAALATPSVRGRAAAGANGSALMLPPGAGGGAAGGSVRAIAGVAATPGMMLGGTPRSGGGVSNSHSATPMRTPLRDELGINDADALEALAGMMEGQGRRAAAARQAAQRSELRERLGALPSPANEYTVALPQFALEDEEQDGEPMEEDASDVRARKAAEAEARRQAEEAKKSKALQRGLPRPLSLDGMPPAKPTREAEALPLTARADEALRRELQALITHDAVKYPLGGAAGGGKDKSDKKGAGKKGAAPAAAAGPVPHLDAFHGEELAEAAAELASEMQYVKAAMEHGDIGADEYSAVWQAVHRDLVWVPAKGRYERLASATNTERLNSLTAEHDAVRSSMQSHAQRGEKLRAKCDRLIGGLATRHGALAKQLEAVWVQLQEQSVQLTSFKALRARELVSAPERLEALSALLAVQRTREEVLQERYKAAARRREELGAALSQQQAAAR